MAVGLEPDECFYIQNYQAVIGKDRINLEVDPPPDLAIEADLTSKTQREAYEALGVPELWIYTPSALQIYVLQSRQYEQVSVSPTFPDLPIAEMVCQAIEQAQTVGYSRALAEFETRLSQEMGTN